MEKRNCNEEERIPNDVITFSSFILFYFLMSNHIFSVSFVSLPHLLLLPTYGRGGLCELNDKINLFFSLLQAGHTLILRRSLGHLMLLMTLLFFFFSHSRPNISGILTVAEFYYKLKFLSILKCSSSRMS